MSGPGVGLLVALLKALARLALPADAQSAELARRGLLPSIDELALELHDMAPLLPQFVANEWLTAADAAAITEIDQMLSLMSGASNQELWTETALRESSEWAQVRRRAREALAG